LLLPFDEAKLPIFIVEVAGAAVDVVEAVVLMKIAGTSSPILSSAAAATGLLTIFASTLEACSFADSVPASRSLLIRPPEVKEADKRHITAAILTGNALLLEFTSIRTHHLICRLCCFPLNNLAIQLC
jgi:hypothetical protein